MKSVLEAKINAGERVIVRVDWNVPLAGGIIEDDIRIKASLPTLNFLLEQKARVLVLSHFSDDSISLRDLVVPISSYFPGIEVIFMSKEEFDSGNFEQFESLARGGLVILENIRFWKEEEMNDPEFARKIASLGDVYVNEAFSVSHRQHASIALLPTFLPHYAGIHLLEEVAKLSEVLDPPHPSLIILGGAKIETKLPLIESLIDRVDHVFIGGKMAVEASQLPLATSGKVFFPKCEYTALDADQATLDSLRPHIQNAKMIVWNGPVGKYEASYKAGSFGIAKMLVESKAKVVVGGGDTLLIVDELGLRDQFYFVSLGGGAMLDFLATRGALPGLRALEI